MNSHRSVTTTSEEVIIIEEDEEEEDTERAQQLMERTVDKVEVLDPTKFGGINAQTEEEEYEYIYEEEEEEEDVPETKPKEATIVSKTTTQQFEMTQDPI
jgi:hypothetical protein